MTKNIYTHFGDSCISRQYLEVTNLLCLISLLLPGQVGGDVISKPSHVIKTKQENRSVSDRRMKFDTRN